ncbi:MAG: response regulator transcription factor [Rhodobacteraceae bacterium]|nr:response regulator transcription factor [Paracoccaceae bacterium]
MQAIQDYSRAMAQPFSSILIVDDHALVRETLAAAIRGMADVRVEIANGLEECLELIARTGGFDLVLVDYFMPGMGGLEGLGQVIAANADRPVAVISADFPPDLAARAIEIGARGIIPKAMPLRNVMNALVFIASGETFVPVTFQIAMQSAPRAPIGLSEAENRVLEQLLHGLSNKEIARELGLSEPTIKMHLRAICQKLGARNRTQAALIARDMVEGARDVAGNEGGA